MLDASSADAANKVLSPCPRLGLAWTSHTPMHVFIAGVARPTTGRADTAGAAPSATSMTPMRHLKAQRSIRSPSLPLPAIRVKTDQRETARLLRSGPVDV